MKSLIYGHFIYSFCIDNATLDESYGYSQSNFYM